MSLGSYKTEINSGSIKEAFARAGLIESGDNVCRHDVLRILRLYVINDLLYHPISACQFGRYLKAADKALDDLLVKDVMND